MLLFIFVHIIIFFGLKEASCFFLFDNILGEGPYSNSAICAGLLHVAAADAPSSSGWRHTFLSLPPPPPHKHKHTLITGYFPLDSISSLKNI
jgi:hypothetical protein